MQGIMDELSIPKYAPKEVPFCMSSFVTKQKLVNVEVNTNPQRCVTIIISLLKVVLCSQSLTPCSKLSPAAAEGVP